MTLSTIRELLHRSANSSHLPSILSVLEDEVNLENRIRAAGGLPPTTLNLDQVLKVAYDPGYEEPMVYDHKFTCVNLDCESFDHWIHVSTYLWSNFVRYGHEVPPSCPSCRNDLVYIGTTAS